MRILVGTLATIENEFDACTASIQRQTHRDFEQFVIRDLPNKQAHDTLYRTFMSRSEAFDLLIKIDADMVLADDRFFEKVVERFQEHKFKENNPPTQLETKTTGHTTKTHPTYPPPSVLPAPPPPPPAPAPAPSIMNALIISVQDWFSDRLIEGLHVYRSNVRWEANNERVFVDRACLPANQIVYDRTTLAPAAYHCPDPSPFQAFHYGLHKGVKVLAAIRGHRRATAEFHITNIEQTWQHFLRRGDRRLALACLGAELALAGWFEAQHVDVQDHHAHDVFQDYKDLNAVSLRQIVKKRRRRNATWLSPMVRAEWLAVGPLRFMGRRIVPVKWHSQMGRWIRRVNSPLEKTPKIPPEKSPERISKELPENLPGARPEKLPGLSISSGTEPVTWLLPVKDAMPYLRHTLESIANQTYPHHRLIAWDNGSTDNSVEELQRWVPAKIPGVVVTDRPMGLGACLAAMVDLAPTELCARIDGDDVNESHRLIRQVEFLIDHPNVGIVGSDIQFIDTLGRETQGAWTVQTQDADIRWRLRFCNAMNHPTVMFRRSVIRAAGNYRDLKPGQDYDLWLRLLSLTTMANLPHTLVRYRVHERSVGATHQGEPASVNRQIASQHTTQVFPGLSHELAMRVSDLGLFDSDIAVSIRDCLLFRRAATLAAGNQWLPPYYFRDTQLFKSQYRRLLAKLLLRRAQQEKKPTTLHQKHNRQSELRRAG